MNQRNPLPRITFRAALVVAIGLCAFAGRASAQGWPSWTADCTNNAVPNSTVGGVTWTPKACQEFNEGIAAGAPVTMDTSQTAWTYDTGGGGFGNNEIEIYCAPPGFATGTGNAGCPNGGPATNTEYVDASGHLVIQALNAGVNNSGTWYSARLKTQGVQSFQYGRIEASIQLPDTTNPGLWPAFWAMGTNITTVGWPMCGESDFMEVWSPSVNSGPGTGHNKSTIHTAVTGGSGLQPNGTFTFPTGQANDTAFHQYGVIWSTNMVQFYVDNAAQPFYIVTSADLPSGDTWPFNATIFVLMNTAVGGTLGCGSVSPCPTASTPSNAASAYMVDYVRQYSVSSAAFAPPALGTPTPPSLTVTAGATTGDTTTFTVAPPPGVSAGSAWYSYINCSTNAPAASCSISTDNTLNHFVIDFGGNITVTFKSTARGWLPFLLNPSRWKPRIQVVIPVFLIYALFLLLVRRRRIGRGLAYGLAVGSLALVGTIVSGCGGGSGGSGGGTTAGSYTMTVGAFTESNTTGTPDATATVKVTVN